MPLKQEGKWSSLQTLLRRHSKNNGPAHLWLKQRKSTTDHPMMNHKTHLKTFQKNRWSKVHLNWIGRILSNVQNTDRRLTHLNIASSVSWLKRPTRLRLQLSNHLKWMTLSFCIILEVAWTPTMLFNKEIKINFLFKRMKIHLIPNPSKRSQRTSNEQKWILLMRLQPYRQSQIGIETVTSTYSFSKRAERVNHNLEKNKKTHLGTSLHRYNTKNQNSRCFHLLTSKVVTSLTKHSSKKQGKEDSTQNRMLMTQLNRRNLRR